MLTKGELKEYIIVRFDPDEVIELLDLSTEELLVYLLDICYKKQHLFVDETDVWEEEE